MVQGDSPAVARRRVRLALRETREAGNLTQSQVADAMEWSLSKVMRIESGEVAIAPNDLKPLLAYLGVTDATRVSELLDAARAAKRRKLWSDEPRFREHLTQATRQLIQYEAEARAVRHFHHMLIPGRLQIAAYTRAILHAYQSELSEEIIQVRMDSRMRRRADLLARKDPPEIFVVLDESVLHREVGGSKVMGEQLADLVRLTKDLGVAVRVVSMTAAAPFALMGPFDILEMGSVNDAVLYREDSLADEIVEDQAKIRRHRDHFEQLWGLAYDATTSIKLLEERARHAFDAARGRSPG
jgi:transcriptional regulator with XRE-family HTH domain